MQSDLSDAFLDARRRIAVPPVPLARIRDAAAAAHHDVPIRTHRKGIVASLMTGAAVVAVTVAAAAGVWHGVHVSFSPSGTSIITSDIATDTLSPTIEQVRAAARRANFPVILPAGLPGDDLPLQMFMMRMKTGGQSAIALTYKLPGRRGDSAHFLTFVLAGSETQVDSGQAIPGMSTTHSGRTVGKGELLWKIGHEYVIVFQSAATPAELEKIHRAMLAQVPHESRDVK
jgi:hypothetical protein